MTTYKRINGDYNIVTLNALDNVSIETHTLEVRGNLDVVGNLTYINVSELNIRDPFILLNSSNTGTYAANAGVLTHIDSSTFAGIRYNASGNAWEISSNTGTTGETGTWEVLATANSAVTAAGSDSEIQFNQSGVFGASTNFRFNYIDNIVQLAGSIAVANTITVDNHQVFANTSVIQESVANSVVIYHNAEGSGGTGLYIKTETTDDELISRSKAIIYSLIF